MFEIFNFEGKPKVVGGSYRHDFSELPWQPEIALSLYLLFLFLLLIIILTIIDSYHVKGGGDVFYLYVPSNWQIFWNMFTA